MDSLTQMLENASPEIKEKANHYQCMWAEGRITTETCRKMLVNLVCDGPELVDALALCL